MDLKYNKILYSGKYGNIYDPGIKGLIICEYWGVWRVDDKECIKDFEAGINIIIKNKAIVDICDHRKQHVITSDMSKWIIDHWYKKLYKHGLKYEICIIPELNAAKISFNRLISKEIIEGIRVETYDSSEEAYKKALQFLK